jgi:DNA-binding transcriptional ArsR family regulator
MLFAERQPLPLAQSGQSAQSAEAAEAVEAVEIFAALGDSTRLYLVTRLCDEGPQAITRLAEGTDLSRQAVTKHLEVLSAVGLATSERSGRERHWRIEAERLAEVRRMLDRIARRWDVALGRLRAMVETVETVETVEE